MIELRRRVGMVFQKPTPFPKSIYENVAYGLRIAGVRRRASSTRPWKRASAARPFGTKSRTGCTSRPWAFRRPAPAAVHRPRHRRQPGNHSHGRALLGPGSASTTRIEDLIGELRGEYTIIIVTHNMQQAARVSDCTAFLYEGALIEFGPTKQLFTKPEKKETEDYITGRFG